MSTHPSRKFWRDKRVLLTGHTGFKGSWMALWLSRLGAQVTGFALSPDNGPSLFHMARVESRIACSILGDLRDEAAVSNAVRCSDPQVILHLGAQPIVRRAIAEPVDTIATNVLGAAHLLDAARTCENLESILVITSDKVYANDGTPKAFVEGDQLGGKDAYSASKAAAELIVRAFARSYFEPHGVKVATARGGNVVGGGDFAQDRVVPDILRAIAHCEPVTLRMPQATRPWQHVLDCVNGYLVYAERLTQDAHVPRALNFGPTPGEDVTVAQLTDALLSAMEASHGWITAPQPQDSVEMNTLAINSTLARATLNWRDKLVGDALVAWTAEWHTSVTQGSDAFDATMSQIDKYECIP